MITNSTITRFCLLLIVSLAITSCTKDFGDGQENFESVIVLNSAFLPGEIMSIKLTNSISIFDKDENISGVIDARVTVKDEESGELYTLNHVGEGLYQSDIFRPQYEIDYTVIASSEGYGTVEATSSIPYPVIANISNSTEGFNDAGDYEAEIELEFVNEEKAPKFYVWEVVDDNELFNQDFTFDQVLDNPVMLTSKSDNTDSVLADESFQSRVFYTDNGDNADPYRSKFITPTTPSFGAQTTSDIDEELAPRIQVRVMTVSEDLYQYFKSVEIYRSRGIHNSSITQPSEIYSNVKGGIGIFAGYHQRFLDFK